MRILSIFIIISCLSIGFSGNSTTEEDDCSGHLRKSKTISWEFGNGDAKLAEVMDKYLNGLATFNRRLDFRELGLSRFEFDLILGVNLTPQRLSGPWLTEELFKNLLIQFPELVISEEQPSAWAAKVRLQGPPPERVFRVTNTKTGAKAAYFVVRNELRIGPYPTEQ